MTTGGIIHAFTHERSRDHRLSKDPQPIHTANCTNPKPWKEPTFFANAGFESNFCTRFPSQTIPPPTVSMTGEFKAASQVVPPRNVVQRPRLSARFRPTVLIGSIAALRRRIVKNRVPVDLEEGQEGLLLHAHTHQISGPLVGTLRNSRPMRP